jgi:hypothetical protein
MVGKTDEREIYNLLDEHVRLGLRELSEFSVEGYIRARDQESALAAQARRVRTARARD